MYEKIRIGFLTLAAMLIGILMVEAAHAPQCTPRIVQSSDEATAPGVTPPASSIRCD
jgi:hypothetical protein